MNTQDKFIELFEKIAKENNVEFEYYFKGNSGRYVIKDKKVLTSRPINAERLQVGLHEIGHHLFINVKPNYLQEYLCEMFSFEIMKNNGIKIKKKVKEKSKRYIAYKTQKAIHRGLKEVNKDVAKYLRKSYPATARGEVRFI